MNPANALIIRSTAAVGTEFAGPYSYGTYNIPHVERFIFFFFKQKTAYEMS